jgi:hypothetical protein
MEKLPHETPQQTGYEMSKLHTTHGARPCGAWEFALSQALSAHCRGDRYTSGSEHFRVMSIQGWTESAVSTVAQRAIDDDIDVLLTVFGFELPGVCLALLLIQRTRSGAEVYHVKPYRQDGHPMLLVEKDREGAFGLNKAGELVAYFVPGPRMFERGMERAWDEIHKRMADIEAVQHLGDARPRESSGESNSVGCAT